MSDFLFQCVPDRYDLSKLKVPPARPETWQATRYRRNMRPDDGVFFYMTGSAAGIYGYGHIIALPDEEEMSVRVKWAGLYPSPIPRKELESLMGENILFSVRVGTNFLLSHEESVSVRNFITSQKLQVP